MASRLGADDYLRIARYLGYSYESWDIDYITEQSQAVTIAGPDYEKQIRNLLRELDQLQDSINDMRLGAGRSFQSTPTSTAQFFPGARLAELRTLMRYQINTLAQLLNVDVKRDILSLNQNHHPRRLIRG